MDEDYGGINWFFYIVRGVPYKKEWKYRILTLFIIALYILIRIFSFQNESVRYLIEMIALYFYGIFYCQKNLGRNFMYLTMISVTIDVAGVLAAGNRIICY